MRFAYILVSFIILTFCENQKKVKVYMCEPIVDDSVIRGQNLDAFFKKNDSSRKIHYWEVSLTQDINNEIDKLKTYVENKGNRDNGIGIYYFALIRNNDTLYSSSDFESWKYKNFVGVYKSDLIKKTMSQN